MSLVQRQPVRSSAIRSIGYDTGSSTLEVEFVNGRVYRYLGVPEFLFRGLMLAGSKGSYFNRNIAERFNSTEAGSAAS